MASRCLRFEGAGSLENNNGRKFASQYISASPPNILCAQNALFILIAGSHDGHVTPDAASPARDAANTPRACSDPLHHQANIHALVSAQNVLPDVSVHASPMPYYHY